MRKYTGIFTAIGLALLLAPSASADTPQWEDVSGSTTDLGVLTRGSDAAFCTGDTQLNFHYQPKINPQEFSSITTTVAGKPYRFAPTETGWNTSIGAEKTGTVAAILDLYDKGGSRETYSPETYALAIKLLTDDAGRTTKYSEKLRKDARTIVAQAERIAGPHRIGNISVIPESDAVDAVLTIEGFTVVGKENLPIGGIPFTATLHGATWESGENVLTGTTSAKPQIFDAVPAGAGKVSLDVEFTEVPGYSFRTGHHPVAQDMHMVGPGGKLVTKRDLRTAYKGRAEISTAAQLVAQEGGFSVVDDITIAADNWPAATQGATDLNLIATLYGPFAKVQDQQAHVPDDAPVAGVTTLTVNEPGKHHAEFTEVVRDEGWYTVVVTGEFDSSGPFAGLEAEPIAMDFFEPSESVYVPASMPEPVPTPDAEPEPTPDPQPSPTPEPAPEPEPEPEPESTPEPEPESTPEPNVAPTPTPDETLQPKPTPLPHPHESLAYTGASEVKLGVIGVSSFLVGVLLVMRNRYRR